jgi:FKBP-type peptidyl-prolyl cis-trans isomerase 2
MTPEAHPDAPAQGVTAAGDLVRIEYDLWGEGGGKTELLDTTHEEVVEKANAPKPEGRSWGPRPHEIGGDYFPAGIEKALVGIPVGEEVQREFAPADAFGERDPNLIELFSMHEIERLPEMRREGAHLDIGTVLTIEGRRGRVVSMTAARVRVDFNPPFAGRKVRGTFKVLEQITEPVAKVRAVLELQYGRSAEFHVEHHEKTITLKLPERSKFDIAWMAAKPRVVDRLRTYLHPETIRIVEEYATPVPEKKEETAPSSAQSEKKPEATAVEGRSKTEGTKAPGGAKGASRAPAKAPAPAPKDA